MAILFLLAAVLWGRTAPQRLKAVGCKGVAACFFLAGQDLAITAAFLLTTVRTM
jgi:hypothetical protein